MRVSGSGTVMLVVRLRVRVSAGASVGIVSGLRLALCPN